MSTTSSAGPAPARGDADAIVCAVCGARLDADQEWCLECGLARTIVRRPPDWRIPVATAAFFIVGAIVAFVIVLANLDGSGTPGAGSASAGLRAGGPTALRSGHAAAAIGSWPPGLSGWTVVLARDATQGLADATAGRLAAHGLSVGVLDTSQHPHLKPGAFYVYTGRFPSPPQANALAAKLVKSGQPVAVVREIAQPGGI